MTSHTRPLRDLIAGFTAERTRWLRRPQWNRPLSRTGALNRPCSLGDRACWRARRSPCEHDIADRIMYFAVAGGYLTASLGEELRDNLGTWGHLESLALDALPAKAPLSDVFILSAALEMALPSMMLVLT